MVMTARELVKDVDKLVSLPEAFAKVNRMIGDPKTTSRELGNVISHDPALSARLLKIANSPFYGLTKKVDSVTRAVTYIGMGQLRDLVLAGSASKVFEGIPNNLVSMDDFWRHSIYCGLAAASLAKQLHRHKLSPDSMFAAGLLHDLGQLIMFHRYPQPSHEALLLCLEDPEHPDMFQAERRVFGFDHMEVGIELLRNWSVPENLQVCAGYHHEPARAPSCKAEAAVAHLSNIFAGMLDLETVDLNDAMPVDPSVWGTLGCGPEVVEPTIATVKAQFDEVWSMLTGPVAS